MVIVSEDMEGQFDRIKGIADKYKIKIINFSLRKDFQQKEITMNFRLRVRTVHPDRNIMKEVFNVKGIKQIEFKY